MTHSLRVKVAGVSIVFRSDMEVDICHLRDLYRHHVVGEFAAGPEHEVRIETVTKSVLPSDVRLVWSGYYHGVGCDGHFDNTVKKYVSADGKSEYFVTPSGECLINDLTKPLTVCTLMSRRKMFAKGRVRSNVGTMVILLTHIVAARHCRYTLHASSVAWRERAVVFVGRSGQGKSTLCLDLVARGAGFMGDDIVFAYQEGGIVKIAPLLFDAKMFEPGKKEKTFIDVTSKYGSVDIEGLPLQAICEIEQTREGESVVKEQSDSDRLFDVFLQSANNLALQYDNEDWLTLCATVMSNYRLYKFYFGDRQQLSVDSLNALYE